MTQAADPLMLKVLATLNEAQARWFVAREVLARGRGGLKAIHEATGISRPTILKGIRELRTKKALPSGERIRRPGGGRKRVEAVDPRWEQALDRIMDENTAGDPMSLLRWTNKSTVRIAEELTRQGHSASDETVRRRLRALGYSLQANVKNREEGSGAGRDEQFRYLNRQVNQYLVRGEPVLSVDTKKKERVGNFKNSGQTWRPQGQPLEVNTYDYPHLGEGPAIPYGAYDVHRNEGFVNVGISHDTAEFAVESLRRWWKLFGRRHYPDARRLLLCADGGGSNGSRNRAWKYYLQQLADQLGLEVTVGHYPPGTSKWNKIEHRLFSFISLNWKGQPLVSYETVVNLIGATRTKTGLRVRAELDAKQYEAGIKISDAQMERINLRPHSFHPLWNYTISPR
ncbi:MAG: ISAzo13 family transposase, partial [Terriglobia bacterium]|nr:ISAzo13 family transposase [Terriglobia bacterium]